MAKSVKNATKSHKPKIKIKKPPEPNYRPQQFLLSAILAYIIVTVANQALLDQSFSNHKQYSYNQINEVNEPKPLPDIQNKEDNPQNLKQIEENYLLDVINRIKETTSQQISENTDKTQNNVQPEPYKLSVSPSILNKKPETPQNPVNFEISNTQSNTPISSSNCPAVQPPTHSSYSSTPKYKLRSTHFLSSILSWGPNNQLRGLMETIVLSIKLNRTLILPPFYKHLMDLNSEETETTINTNFTKFGQLVEPWLWFDVTKISSLLSIDNLSAMQSACDDDKFNVAFLAKPINKGPMFQRIQSYESYTKIRFTKGENAKFSKKKDESEWLESDVQIEPSFRDIQALCGESKGDKTQALRLPMDSTKIKNLYSSDGKCAVWAFPYRNFDFKQIWKYSQKPGENYSMPAFGSSGGAIRGLGMVGAEDVQLMMEAVEAIQPNSFIKNIYQKITERVFFNSKKYFAIHWRYIANEQDETGSNKDTLKAICTESKRITLEKNVFFYRITTCIPFLYLSSRTLRFLC